MKKSPNTTTQNEQERAELDARILSIAEDIYRKKGWVTTWDIFFYIAGGHAGRKHITDKAPTDLHHIAAVLQRNGYVSDGKRQGSRRMFRYVKE